MADNIQLNLGAGGEAIASDDDGTAQHQYVKLEFGPDNTQTKVSDTNPLPINPRESDGTTLVNTHDAAAGDAGQLGMLKAQSTDPTSVGDGDAVVPMADLKGRAVVTRAPRELVTQAETTITSSTSETTILAAGGAGVFNDLTALIVTRSGGQWSGDLDVTIRDKPSGDGGTTIFSLNFQASSGGLEVGNNIFRFDPPWQQGTANKAWVAESSASSSDPIHIAVQAIVTSA